MSFLIHGSSLREAPFDRSRLLTFVRVVDLPVAVRVQEHQIGLIVRAAFSLWEDVVEVPPSLLVDELAAVRASLFLGLPEAKQSLSPFEAVLHRQAEPLFEVRLPGWVEWVRPALDLDVASDRRVTGLNQLDLALTGLVSP